MEARNTLSKPVPPSSSTTGGLYDKPGAAEYLGTTERHIERLWTERRISAVHVGRKVRFRREDLDSFILSNRVEAVR